MNLIILVLFFSSFLFPKCNGFNWYHDMNVRDCNQKDIQVLQKFIDNSRKTINYEMDVNLNNKIEPLELGWQLWEDGRLIHWICNDVPSPFYIYNYNCGLSGSIPDDIGDLESIVKMHLQDNKLKGSIPRQICDLDISKSNNYWLKINQNNLCPPYPECMETFNMAQKSNKCD